MLEKLAGLIPDFLDRLLRLAASPSAFATGLNADSQAELRAALGFYLVCIALSVALSRPAVGGGLDVSLVPAVLVAGLETLTAAVIIVLAWRMVGGRAPFRPQLLASFHVLGIAAVIPALGSLLAYTLFTAASPEQTDLYREFMRRLVLEGGPPADPRFETLTDDPALDWAMAAYAAGQFATLAWVLWCWRAYRDLNRASNRRAAVALAVTLALSIPVALLFAHVARTYGSGVF